MSMRGLVFAALVVLFSLDGVSAASAAEVQQWVSQVSVRLDQLRAKEATDVYAWVTNIGPGTALAAAQSTQAVLSYIASIYKDAQRYRETTSFLDEDTVRALVLIQLETFLPPSDDATYYVPQRVNILTNSLAGTVCYTVPGSTSTPPCQDLDTLNDQLAQGIVAATPNVDLMAAIWNAWHDNTKLYKQDFLTTAAKANSQAKQMVYKGATFYAHLGEYWRDMFDMSPADVGPQMDAIYLAIRPLYAELHCYLRRKLYANFPSVTSSMNYLPAHLLGNMYGSDFSALYKFVTPYPDEPGSTYDIAQQMKSFTGTDLVTYAVNFFKSFSWTPDPPDTIYPAPKGNSQVSKPTGMSSIVCDSTTYQLNVTDERIQTCASNPPDVDDLLHVIEAVGQAYYDGATAPLNSLFRNEKHPMEYATIKAALLSLNTNYLKNTGLLPGTTSTTDKGLVNALMRRALKELPNLVFNYVTDKWRDQFLEGLTSAGIPVPANINAIWWDMVRQYQGIDYPANFLSTPVSRTEEVLDPLAHMNVGRFEPQYREVLSTVIAYQIHGALCTKTGQTPPHKCSLNSVSTGQRLYQLLQSGSTAQWQLGLVNILGAWPSGSIIDPKALMQYYQPLMDFLTAENAAEKSSSASNAAKCRWGVSGFTVTPYKNSALTLALRNVGALYAMLVIGLLGAVAICVVVFYFICASKFKVKFEESQKEPVKPAGGHSAMDEEEAEGSEEEEEEGPARPASGGIANMPMQLGGGRPAPAPAGAPAITAMPMVLGGGRAPPAPAPAPAPR